MANYSQLLRSFSELSAELVDLGLCIMLSGHRNRQHELNYLQSRRNSSSHFHSHPMGEPIELNQLRASASSSILARHELDWRPLESKQRQSAKAKQRNLSALEEIIGEVDDESADEQPRRESGPHLHRRQQRADWPKVSSPLSAALEHSSCCNDGLARTE